MLLARLAYLYQGDFSITENKSGGRGMLLECIDGFIHVRLSCGDVCDHHGSRVATK